jgi:transcriptional regulator with XRE-family HTH domain
MINRIQLILKTKNISPSQFADQIQVQRSGVSHILSGRNNPSLDFILKILRTFPEIDADWLLFGKGQMNNLATKPEVSAKVQEEIPAKKKVQPDLFAQSFLESSKEEPIEVKVETPAAVVVPEKVIEKETEVKPPVAEITENPKKTDQQEKIEKIVVFYSNTFKEYSPK